MIILSSMMKPPDLLFLFLSDSLTIIGTNFYESKSPQDGTLK